MQAALHKTRVVLEMIKFEHSIFALPFALTGALLAVRGQDLPSSVLVAKFFWIVVAMVAARSAAMAFNRVVDADIDAKNPRTSMRAIPAGQVSRSFTWGFIVFWSAVLVAAAAMLNPLCLALSPVAYRGVVLRGSDGKVLACGQSAIEADTVGLYDVFTATSARGSGLSRWLCARLLNDARRQGAQRAYLQVEAQNHAARSLYRRLGFADAYRYHYRARPAARD